jgi:hypothetical protein
MRAIGDGGLAAVARDAGVSPASSISPFDASRAPLLRATLLHGADRSVIILCVHHSINGDCPVRRISVVSKCAAKT